MDDASTLLCVLCRLGARDLVSAAAVSRRWRAVATSDALWRPADPVRLRTGGAWRDGRVLLTCGLWTAVATGEGLWQQEWVHEVDDAGRLEALAEPAGPFAPGGEHEAFARARTSLCVGVVEGYAVPPGSAAPPCCLADWLYLQSSPAPFVPLQLVATALGCCLWAGRGVWRCVGRDNGCAGGEAFGSGPYSCGSDYCAAALHAGALGPAGGSVRVFFCEGRDDYRGTERNGVATLPCGASARSFNFGHRPEPPDNAAARSPSIASALLRLLCPDGADDGVDAAPRATCGHVAEEVWVCLGSEACTDANRTLEGDGLYTAASSPCLAARHAGVVGRRGGRFALYHYSSCTGVLGGSEKHGLRSSAVRAGSRCFSVVAAPKSAPDEPRACGRRANDLHWCCGLERGCLGGPVWGTDLYAFGSNMCSAAMHAGVIGAGGGYFRVSFADVRTDFVGTHRNGVCSLHLAYKTAAFAVFPPSQLVPPHRVALSVLCGPLDGR
eukprot:m51a1_g9297 putative transmembrane sensor protein (497) ;mRNA; f:52141-54007